MPFACGNARPLSWYALWGVHRARCESCQRRWGAGRRTGPTHQRGHKPPTAHTTCNHTLYAIARDVVRYAALSEIAIPSGQVRKASIVWYVTLCDYSIFPSKCDAIRNRNRCDMISKHICWCLCQILYHSSKSLSAVSRNLVSICHLVHRPLGAGWFWPPEVEARTLLPPLPHSMPQCAYTVCKAPFRTSVSFLLSKNKKFFIIPNADCQSNGHTYLSADIQPHNGLCSDARSLQSIRSSCKRKSCGPAELRYYLCWREVNRMTVVLLHLCPR